MTKELEDERSEWVRSGRSMDHHLAVKLLRALAEGMDRDEHYESCNPAPEAEAIRCILGEVTNEG